MMMASRKRSGQQLEPGGQIKRSKHEECHLNSTFTSDAFISKLSRSWRECLSLEDAPTSAELLSSPFQCCILPNFIAPSSSPGPRHGVANGATTSPDVDEPGSNDFLKDLISELLRLKFYEKNNDLYQFHQSDDLKKFKTPSIAALRSLFHDECLPWLRKVTGLELMDTIDMTCSKYEYTDVLLCHDDELEGRRIAFIFYLVNDWSVEDGGTLDLFDTNDVGQPGKVVKSLVPKWNSLVFFDVNAVSFHQVSEVLAAGKTRLSINGWFHGPPSSRRPIHKPHPLPFSLPGSLGLQVLSDWINPTYLDVGVLNQIQQQFEAESQIQLPNFLLEEKYGLLCEEMTVSQAETKWAVQGPPNYKHTCVASTPSLLPLTRSFMNLVLSKPFCLLLAHMTDLDLAQDVIRVDKQCLQESKKSCHLQVNAEEACMVELASRAQCRGEVYCWRPGNYTLAQEAGQERACLEAGLSFNCTGWSEEFGGVVNYIISDSPEDPEVLTICPTPNCLSLVYREKDLLHFTKYVNHRSQDLARGPLYTANMTYIEHAQSDEQSEYSEDSEEDSVQ